MKKKCFFVLLFLFFIGLDSVYAATAGSYGYNSTVYCYKKDGTFLKVGKATFHSASNITTDCPSGSYSNIYKTINGEEAYCAQAQLNMLIGKNKTCTLIDNYNSSGKWVANNKYSWMNSNWTELNALVIGDAMNTVRSNTSYSAGQKTAYIHSILSQVLRFKGAHPTQTLIADIQNVISASKAKKYERTISTNAVSAKFQSNILDTVGVSYSKGVLNVTLTNTSTIASMDVVASCSNCKVYVDSAYKTLFTKETVAKATNASTPATKNLTLYVKTNGMYASGTSVEVKFTASSKWTYPIGNLWYCGSGKQSVMTVGTKEYSASKSFSAPAITAGVDLTCSFVGGKYYGKDGTAVTEAQYQEQCLHTCSYYDGKYYGKDGSTVITQDEYKKQCGREVRNGKYYDDNGNEVTQNVYNQKCGRTVVFYKKDVYGDLLRGANVDVTLGTSGSCTTNGASSCKAYFSKDLTSITYKIHEAKSPDGYINSPDITNSLDLKTTQNTCHRNRITNEEKNWVSTSLSDCDTVYANETICYDNENNVWKQDITSEDACKSPEPVITGDGSNAGTTGTDTGSEAGGGTGTETGGSTSGEGTGTDTGGSTSGEGTGTETGGSTSGAGTGTETGGSTSGEGTSGSDTQGSVYENKWTWGSKCVNKTNNTLATDIVETVGTGDDAVKYTKCDYDYVRVTSNGDVYYLEMTNTLNSIGFSKVDSNGEMISGARLKVCTETEYNKSKLDCDAYQPVGAGENETVSWFSSNKISVFNGFVAGKYYLVEELSATGYKLNSTPVGFSVDKDGNVALLDSKNGILRKESESSNLDVVVIENDITKLSVSKSDIATKKEVPGAQISICYTYDANADEEGKKPDYKMAINNSGECIPVVLSDGTEAVWTSTDKSHEIIGLPVGTYFLVEKLAPNGYSTAESIMFTLKSDGTLVDKDGKSLANNKIVMYDKKINDVKTGMLGLYITFCIIVFAAVGGASSYFLLKKNKVNEI